MDKRRHTEVVCEALPPLTGLAMLDVGCGRGGLAGWLNRQGAQITGVDAQPAVLRAAHAAGVAVAAATAQALPFAAATFEATLIFNSLHHFPEPAGALAEARRVTVAGGVLFVAEPLAEGAHFSFMQPLDDESEVRASALDALADAGGRGWALERRFDYAYDVVVADLEAEMRGWVAVDPARAARIDDARPEIEARFHRHGIVTERGHAFLQPMRAWRFRAA